MPSVAALWLYYLNSTYDCGLFVVAFATYLAIGVQPGSFTFKQQEVFREWEDADVEDKKRVFIS